MKMSVELKELNGDYFILLKGIYVEISEYQYTELQKAFKRKQAYKPYVVSIDNELYYETRKEPYRLKCHFCIGDLKSIKLQRYFNSEYRKVIEMVVKEIATKKIIYKGNNYKEYLQVVENLMKGVKKDERN